MNLYTVVTKYAKNNFKYISVMKHIYRSFALFNVFSKLITIIIIEMTVIIEESDTLLFLTVVTM